MSDEIDQLLFGYRDGHGLIAGSRALSASQLREVLPHVDATIERPGGRALVGMWVASLERYLLARIWPAPECSRPGAVWAHALLIPPARLREATPSAVEALLCRPDDMHFDSYRVPLRGAAPSVARPATRALTRAVVWAALDGAGRPGIVLWDEPVEAEGPLLALLDALPPAARRQLSFRTSESAHPGAEDYGVVVAPALSGRGATNDHVVIEARQPPPVTPPDWTGLIDDADIGRRLRAFLHRYGAACACSELVALTSIAMLLGAGVAPSDVVRALIERFPAVDQVAELRAALLGGNAADLWELEEEERLALLLEHPGHFDLDAFEVSGRLAALTRRDPMTVLRLIEQARAIIGTPAVRPPSASR